MEKPNIWFTVQIKLYEWFLYVIQNWFEWVNMKQVKQSLNFDGIMFNILKECNSKSSQKDLNWGLLYAIQLPNLLFES